MHNTFHIFIKRVMVLCITIIAAYTTSAQAQTNQVNIFADRNVILEGTVAPIVIESSLTESVAITASISGLPMGGPTTAMLSVSELALSTGTSIASFEVSVQDNDEPQASNETFTVEFAAPAALPLQLPSLTFTIPPNDLTAAVTAAVRLNLNTTANMTGINIAPTLQDSKSFIVSSTNLRLIVNTGIVTPARFPFPVDMELSQKRLYGPAERLNLTVHHIDTLHSLTKPTAQAQIDTGDTHTCIIKADRTVACWGNNDSDRSSPISSIQGVDDDTKFLAVSVADRHSCAIKADSRIACWGSNGSYRSQPISSPQDVNSNTKFLTVSAGGYHNCGIRADSRVACWGLNFRGSAEPTSSPDVDDTTQFLAVSAGLFYSCGIKVDGRMACWGYDRYNQGSPTSSIQDVTADTRFVAINAGGQHSCGIKANDTVACWGDNSRDQSSPTSSPAVDATTRFHAVSVGTGYSCGIKAEDSTVACWGDNNRGQATPASSPHGVDATTRFLAVSAGNFRACGIKAADSTVACWGFDSGDLYSNLSSDFQYISTAADVVRLAERSENITDAVELREVRGVVEVLHPPLLINENDTATFTLFLATQGPIKPITITLTIADEDKPFLKINPEQIVLTEASTEGQTTITAGDDNEVITRDPIDIMFAIEPRDNIHLVSTVNAFVATIVDDDAYTLSFTQERITLAEGQSTNVSLNIDPPPTATHPVAVTFPITTDAVHHRGQLDIDPPQVLFTRSSTQREVTVTAVDDILPEDTTRFTVSIAAPPNTPTTAGTTLLVEVLPDTDPPLVTAYAASNIVPEGTAATVVINAILRQPLTIQINTTPTLMSVATTTTVSTSELTLSPQVPSASFHVSAVDNNEPQTGNAAFNVQLMSLQSTHTQSTLTFIVPPNDLTAVATTPAPVFKVTDITQTVMVNIQPTLEDNKSFVVSSTDSRLVPAGIITQAHSPLLVDVALAKDARVRQQEQLNLTIHHIDTRPPVSEPTAQAQIGAGGGHSCAIKDNNTVACWGSSTNNRTNPASADGIDDATRLLAISAGAAHSCGIKTDNTAVCWGSSTNNRTNPASADDIHANTKFLAIDAGGEHNCGIGVDGRVFCWGNPANNRTDPTSSPQGVSTATRFLAISAGGEHSCGIGIDGRMFCWGNPANDRTDPASSIQDVSTDTQFLAMSAGAKHSCGIKVDNTVACWGSDAVGQSSPTTAAGFYDTTRFIAISAGAEHSCALSMEGTALCWGNPANDRTDPTSHPDVNANTTFLAISAGGAHSCGITADSRVVCWGLADDNRTNPAVAGIQQASIAADMVHLAERREVFPNAIEFQEVIDIAVPYPELLLNRGASTRLILFAFSSATTKSATITLQVADPNNPPILNVNPRSLTLSNTNQQGVITITVAGNIGASTYIDPVRIMFRVAADNVRITPPNEDNTINVIIANPDLYNVSLATPDITIAEGTTRIITLNIEPPPSNPVTINLHNSSTDQITVDSTVTFTPGTMSTTATISVPDDSDKEPEITHIIRLTAEQADTRTHISTPELAVTIPADNDRAITITVMPTSLELSPDDSASIHIAVPPRFLITGPVFITADTSDGFITVSPAQLVLNPINPAGSMTVALTSMPPAQTQVSTITLTALSATEEIRLPDDSITVNIINLGINLKIKVYLEGALP